MQIFSETWFKDIKSRRKSKEKAPGRSFFKFREQHIQFCIWNCCRIVPSRKTCSSRLIFASSTSCTFLNNSLVALGRFQWITKAATSCSVFSQSYLDASCDMVFYSYLPNKKRTIKKSPNWLEEFLWFMRFLWKSPYHKAIPEISETYNMWEEIFS